MKTWKTWQICLFTLLCILLNIAGNRVCKLFEMPLWLDSFGTVLSACLLGPVCGALVGITGNLLMSSVSSVTWCYSITSIALAVVVGYGVKKKALDSILGTMYMAGIAVLASCAVSVPVNMVLHSGYTENRFGDGVIDYLTEMGLPFRLSAIIGQFYLEFLDKLVTIFALYLLVHLLRLRGRRLPVAWHRHEGQHPDGDGRRKKRKHPAETAGKTAAVLLLTAGVLSGAAQGEALAAKSDTEEDYNSYIQTVFSSDNGLPCGEANDIAQTSDGILWIGTYAGLYRYNGREFRWIDSMDSVHNCNCLYVDEEGRLWIGTNDSGLAIAINERIVNVIDESNGLPSNSVRAIIRGSDGLYYIGTTKSLQLLTLNGGLRRLGALSEMNNVDNLTADRNGNVAAVTGDGRLFLLNGGKILCSLILQDGNDPVNCCMFAPDGSLKVGTTGNRLLTYRIVDGCLERTGEQVCEGLKNLNDLYFLSDGELFISADNGIGFLNTEGEFRTVNTNDFNNSIDNMLMDYQGNLWFTSSRLGLLRLAQSSFRDLYSVAGMPSRVVNAVTDWQGCTYFGTDKGLDAISRETGLQVRNKLTAEYEGVRIRCLLTDADDHMWLCTYGGGLVEVSPDGSERLYNSKNGGFGDWSRVVTQLSDGSILAAGDTGLSFIRDGKILKTIRYEAGRINSMILSVTELSDGTIIAGTDGDGIAVIRDGEVVEMLTREDGLPSGVILRTVPDTKSEGVFLVTSNSLCFLDEDYNIRLLGKFPYFNNYYIWAKDRDTLFVMSSAGLFIVDRDELLADTETLAYQLLDSRSGLNSSLTANSWCYCNEDGTLYLPCDTGVFAMDAYGYSSDLPSFRMAIPYIRLDNTEYKTERNVAIEIGKNVTRIELLPEIINYSVQIPNVGYYLEGFDGHWYIMPQTSLNSISYTNLPAGNYRLHLAVFDSEGENIVTERIFELNKTQDFHETAGFRAYLVGVTLLLAVFITGLFGISSYESMRKQAEMSNQTIMAIARTVDAKDARTSEHSERVSRYSALIAREMGYTDKACENIRKAAKMHDIGKIAIPDSILNKAGRLTNEEYDVMKSHTVHVGEILGGITLIDHVVEGALYHHERPDGRGYPYGLKGEEIPEYARIIGVADAFDAMTANRVYRKQMDFGYVVNEMKKGRGTQFDPEADDILLKLIEDGTINLYDIYGVSPEEAKKAAEEAGSVEDREAKARSVAEKEAADGKTPGAHINKSEESAQAAAAQKGDENTQDAAKAAGEVQKSEESPQSEATAQQNKESTKTDAKETEQHAKGAEA